MLTEEQRERIERNRQQALLIRKRKEIEAQRLRADKRLKIDARDRAKQVLRASVPEATEEDVLWIDDPDSDEAVRLFLELHDRTCDYLDDNENYMITAQDNNSSRRRKELLMKYKGDQRGRGIETHTRPIIEVNRLDEQERTLPKFGAIHYRGRFEVKHNLNDVDILAMSSEIDKAFSKFVFEKIAKAKPNDFISVNIEHEQLNQSINVSCRAQNFDVKEVANRIFKCSQSNRDWLLAGNFHVEILVNKLGQGGGGAKEKDPLLR